MTWPATQLMAWIQRVEAKAPRATLFELLELGPSADSAAITGAFHRIAAGAHPDLHRHVLAPADAERLLGAYGKIAAAYDTLRDPRTREKYRKELADRGKPIAMPPVIGGSQAIPVQRPVPAAAALAGRTGATTLLPAMTAAGPPRTKPPSSPRITVPPAGAVRAPTPGRGTQTVPAAAAEPPPPASRTTTPSTVRLTAPRATTAPRTTSVPRTTTPPDRPPLITPVPPSGSGASRTAAPPATTTPPPPSSTASPPRGKVDSRPPATGVAPRAQAYFRKAQSCLGQGDLGGALFNLRLAAAADPTSALVRVALAEVEAEIRGGK